MEGETRILNRRAIVLLVVLALVLGLNAYLIVRVNDLQRSLDVAARSGDTAMEDLRGQVTAMSDEITDLQAEFGFLKARVLALEAASGNTTALAEILARLDAAEADIDALEQNLATLRARVDALDTGIASLESTVASLQTRVDSLDTRLGILEARLAALQASVALLELRRPLVVRVSFLSFTQDATPASGNDWLIDVEISGGNCVAQGRTGHSRYVVPKYLDLNTNRSLCSGATVTVKLYAYWHLDDALIDIDPNPASGRCLLPPAAPAGCYLTLTYRIGTTLTGSVDGNSDGYVLDNWDGNLQYRVETPP